MVNRYYSNAYGRFMTPDPYTNSGRLTDPGSWNRYAYTRGDPVNRVDVTGTDDTPTFSITVLDLINTPPIISWPQQSGGGGWGTSQYWASAIGSALAVATSWQQLAIENFQAKSLLDSALQSSQYSGCVSWLENFTGDSSGQLMQAANQTTFIDVTGPAGSGITTSEVGITGPDESLSQYFYGANSSCPVPAATCNIVAVTPEGTPVVLLGALYFNTPQTVVFGPGSQYTYNSPTSTASQAQTLMHEFFHTLGVGEPNGSAAFDNWISGGCQGNPPGGAN